jgi:hypothetical protein
MVPEQFIVVIPKSRKEQPIELIIEGGPIARTEQDRGFKGFNDLVTLQKMGLSNRKRKG